MDKLNAIGERIRQSLEEKSEARDRILQLSRSMIRDCSRAIRAVHRNERKVALERIESAGEMLKALKSESISYPDLFFAGYCRDAMKEYAEANITFALIMDEPLPDPDDLGVPYSAYLCGLGETAGELRRRVLDVLRSDRMDEAGRLLEDMDSIYGLLVTMDFPNPLTGNLRRITDLVRGVTERTRGDLATSIRQFELKKALRDVEAKLDGG
jgi:translin